MGVEAKEAVAGGGLAGTRFTASPRPPEFVSVTAVTPKATTANGKVDLT